MKLQHQIVTGYTAMMAILLAVAATSYLVINRLNDSAKWVAHTHKVISDANYILKIIIDMETGVRGFTVTCEALLSR
ncbi:MAG: CHASE3 domain-containing protein [Verrucomicrobiota bacterium]